MGTNGDAPQAALLAREGACSYFPIAPMSYLTLKIRAPNHDLSNTHGEEGRQPRRQKRSFTTHCIILPPSLWLLTELPAEPLLYPTGWQLF